MRWERPVSIGKVAPSRFTRTPTKRYESVKLKWGECRDPPDAKLQLSTLRAKRLDDSVRRGFDYARPREALVNLPHRTVPFVFRAFLFAAGHYGDAWNGRNELTAQSGIGS